ncbi:unnamed protein product, partial [Ranitomeya imitator]
MEKRAMEHGVFKYTSEDEERILGGLDGEAIFLKTPSTLELKRKYESDVKRMINLQLHMMTLGQYYKEGKIPRGLRSNIRPNLFQGNHAYCARFVMISNKYAMDTILLNIEFLQEEIKKLQQNIEGFECKIKSLITVEEWNIFKEKVDKESVKLRNELEEIKRKKWNRDVEDYEAGHIYTWQRESNKPVWKKKGGDRRNEYNNNYDRCVTNDDFSYRTGEYNRRTTKRKRRGGKRHHRKQKETREKQIAASDTGSQQETGTNIVINISGKIYLHSQQMMDVPWPVRLEFNVEDIFDKQNLWTPNFLKKNFVILFLYIFFCMEVLNFFKFNLMSGCWPVEIIRMMINKY